MKLYGSAASPFVRKVRVVAHEVGLTDRIEAVATSVKPTEPNRAYGEAVNPVRRVPALTTDEGMTLVDSAVICEYLAATAGDRTLYPTNASRWATLNRAALAMAIAELCVQTRYETTVRPEDKRWSAWSDDLLDKVRAGLDALERDPSATEGDFTIASAALGCVLGYLDFRFAEIDWRSSRPRLAAWWEATSERPSLRETRPDI